MAIDAAKSKPESRESPFPRTSILRTDDFGQHALEAARSMQRIIIEFPDGKTFAIEEVKKGTIIRIRD